MEAINQFRRREPTLPAIFAAKRPAAIEFRCGDAAMTGKSYQPSRVSGECRFRRPKGRSLPLNHPDFGECRYNHPESGEYRFSASAQSTAVSTLSRPCGARFSVVQHAKSGDPGLATTGNPDNRMNRRELIIGSAGAGRMTTWWYSFWIWQRAVISTLRR
jgi:hypothetical protein